MQDLNIFIKNITNLIVGNRKDNGNGQDQQIGSTVVEIDEVNKFNILNIELSIPINYYHKSFIFHLFLI
jgi:hypothetical protein